jgi:multiple sugar transport system ATP-binding protein
MIYVTHDQVEAMTMGDRIVVMRDGLIQQIGTPLGLYNNPVNRFVAGFIGSPPMNIMKVDVKDEGGRLFVDEGDFQLTVTGKLADILRPYAGKDILLGVRPEDLIYNETAPPENDMPAKIEVVEPLGAEIHVFVSTAAHPSIVANCPPRFDFQVGETAHFTPDMSKLHFFDMETEQTLTL